MKHTKTSNRTLRRRIALIYLIPMALLMIWGLLVIWLDPLNLYHWRPSYPLLKNELTQNATYLFWNAADSPRREVWVLGASNNNMLKTEHIERAYGKHPSRNLSYNGLTYAEYALILREAEKAGNPLHVYLTLDLNLPSRESRIRPRLTEHLFNHSLWDDHRYWYSSEALVAGYYLLTTGKIWVGNNINPQKQYRYRESGYRVFTTEKNKAGLIARIKENPRMTFAMPKVDCKDYTPEVEPLVSYAKAMKARNIKVDMMFPPYSYAMQSLRQESAKEKFHRDFYEVQIGMARCFVEAMAPYDNVRLFGFDDQAWIGGDVMNYFDSVHYHRNDIVNYLFDSIQQGRHQLNQSNIHAYEQGFLKGLQAYYDGIYKSPPVTGPKATGWDLVY
jgi:hypothetical protein